MSHMAGEGAKPVRRLIRITLGGPRFRTVEHEHAFPRCLADLGCAGANGGVGRALDRVYLGLQLNYTNMRTV